MDLFEQNFNKYILPNYGPKRNQSLDSNLLDTNIFPNTYSTLIDQIRLDKTNLNVYSIDPPGCIDADDAFSIHNDNDELFLSIHIADPTHYIDLKSKLWNDIVDRCITHYPSNNLPINMMPDDIVMKSSLMVSSNNQEEIKNAITVTFQINKENYLPTNNIKINFTKIKVKKNNKLTYEQAGTLINNKYELKVGTKISEAVKNKRSSKTLGTKLSDLSILYPTFENNLIKLSSNNPNEKLMKNMIGEFAILTN